MSANQPELFRTTERHKVTDLRRKERRQKLAAWKQEHGVFTYCSKGHEAPWMAIAVTKAHERLAGYNLTEEEKTNPIAMFAGYCRLLDEYGLLTTGTTKATACIALAGKLGVTPP